MKKFNFNVGADPEFLMFHNYKLVGASSIIPKFLKANGGYITGTGNMGMKTKDGVLGWDGRSVTGELRPNAEQSPEKLATNIGNMYKELHSVLPFLDVTTLSINEPIGGHIHLELPFKTESERTKVNKLLGNSRKLSEIKKILATFLMPVAMADHKISATARMSSGGAYGNLNDVRFEIKTKAVPTEEEEDDSRNTVPVEFCTAEVRGLTAEWQTTKEVAEATIAYLGVLWHEVYFKNKMFSNEPALLRNNVQINQLHSMVLSDYKPIQRSLLEEIRRIVKGFELYGQFKKEVDLILNPSKVYDIKKKAGWNIYNGWNLQTVPAKVTEKSLLSEKQLNTKLKEIDFDSIKEEFNIRYNSDTNVEMFANAIAERIAALGWQLKNDYFLFGIKGEEYAIAQPNKNLFYEMPVKSDPNIALQAIKKMQDRQVTYTNRQIIRIDPKTGNVKPYAKDPLIIGIPYNTRVTKNTREFIKKIIEIEKTESFEETAHNNIDTFLTEYNDNRSARKKETGREETDTEKINASKVPVGTNLDLTDMGPETIERITVTLPNTNN